MYFGGGTRDIQLICEVEEYHPLRNLSSGDRLFPWLLLLILKVVFYPSNFVKFEKKKITLKFENLKAK